MAIGNPRIHIICGMCGNNNMMTYEVYQAYDDDTEAYYDSVYLSCGNCNSLTDINEIMEEKKK